MARLHTKGNWDRKSGPQLDLARRALALQYKNRTTRNRILSGDNDMQYEIQAILYALKEQSK